MKHPNDALNFAGELIEAEPGDLILWDSRALHGAFVGRGLKVQTGKKAGIPELARLSMAVCMLPLDKATPEQLQIRRNMVAKGCTTTHWPLACKSFSKRETHGAALPAYAEWENMYTPIDLDIPVQALIAGPDIDSATSITLAS
jgi:hypothetical protein